MFGLSFWELAMILLVALVVLGPKRLPELARTIGGGLRSLRRASADLRQAIEEPLREVQEPLEEMRRELYQTVHHFEGEIAKSLDETKGSIEQAVAADDQGPSTSGALGAGALGAGAFGYDGYDDERERLPDLAASEALPERGLDGDQDADPYALAESDALETAEPLPEVDERGRIAAEDPFAPSPSGAALLAAGPTPELDDAALAEEQTTTVGVKADGEIASDERTPKDGRSSSAA